MQPLILSKDIHDLMQPAVIKFGLHYFLAEVFAIFAHPQHPLNLQNMDTKKSLSINPIIALAL